MARESQSGIEQQPLRASLRHCTHTTTTKGQKCGYPYGHLNPTSSRNRTVSSLLQVDIAFIPYLAVWQWISFAVLLVMLLNNYE